MAVTRVYLHGHGSGERVVGKQGEYC